MIAVSLLAFCTAPNRAFFTGQVPDKIIYQGKELPLQTNPMEEYFTNHPTLRPGGTSNSSNLDRGYIATFEVKNDTLTLKNIEVNNLIDECPGNFGSISVSVLDKIYPTTKSRTLSWYSGILTIPRGKLIRPGRAGYTARYRRYTLLNIQNGKLSGVVNISEDEYTAFKVRQYERYIKTAEYQTWRQSVLKNGETPETIAEFDNFMYGIQTRYTSAPGDRLFCSRKAKSHSK